jgi:hypothetical protein
MARWWSDVEPLRTLNHAEHIESIDVFLTQIEETHAKAFTGSSNDFMDAVFDVVFDRKVRPILDLQAPFLLESPKRLFKAFTKWITAQLAITSKFHFLPESDQVRKDIISYMLNLSDGNMTIDNVTTVRSVFEQYLHCLAEKNLISHDDEITYAELYPLFDPFYINYDKGAAHYEDLTTISNRIFSIEDYRTKQLAQLARYMGRSLTSTESFYTSIMLELIEAGDGQIIDGIFVTRPGVMLLSESPIAHRLGMVTFLLSGISIETSLEFIAHHEAKVARLTSSKTNAMNVPLFRVQGTDTAQQRRLLASMITARTHFESLNQPRHTWGEYGSEIFNMTQPGCKVTAMCYTMTLEDLHKLFIGRMAQYGNEQEVIHVAERMGTLLHSRYPTLIQSLDYYRTCGNTAKYTTTSPSICSTIVNSEPVQSITLVGGSKLTKAANRLMTTLYLRTGEDWQRLTEFRSRITYLSFPKIPPKDSDQSNYLDKVVDQHGHLSVLDACQVIFQLPEHFVKSVSNSVWNSFSVEHIEQDTLLFTTLKQIKQAVLRSRSIDEDHKILTMIQALVQ